MRNSVRDFITIDRFVMCYLIIKQNLVMNSMKQYFGNILNYFLRFIGVIWAISHWSM